jgi:hypothetical protein
MIRTRLTWVVVGIVVALLVAAGIDALFFSGSQKAESAPTAPTAIAGSESAAALRRCTRLDIRVSIEIRGGVAAAVVREVGLSPCRLRPVPIVLAVTDGAGRRVRLLGQAPVGGNFSPGSEQTANFPEQIQDCDLRAPFVASATVGPYSAHRTVSGRSIGCV